MLVCGPDAVLSHHTAATLHGYTAAHTPDVHVTVPYSNWVRSKKGLVVHHDRFRECDVVIRHGLRIFDQESTIAELLCSQQRWVGLACLDQALSGLNDQQVKEFVAVVGGRLAARDDRRGVRTADALLVLGTSGAESPQESRLRLLVVDAGFPIPVTQYPIYTMQGDLIYRLDMAWPELRIGLEYDGYAAHEDREDFDAERDRRLAGRGWRIIRARKEDVSDPARLFAELRRSFAERRHPIPD
jgi:hypothetical protein